MVALSANGLFAQCDLILREKFDSILNKDKVTELHTFSADLQNEKKELNYAMVLEKSKWYRFYIADSDKHSSTGHFEMRLSDGTLIGTNLNSANGKRYESFDFKCNKTMVYHLSIIKDSGEKYCAEVMLVYAGNTKDESLGSGAKNAPKYDAVVIADVMPRFNNKKNTDEAFRTWIKENQQYPKTAKDNKIEGKVYVNFIVNTEGDVGQVRIIKGVAPVLDNYVIELIKQCPQWKSPGLQDNKPVNVSFIVPVEFKL